MSFGFTKSERAVYDFIVEYIQKNQISPSVREIGKACGYSTNSSPHRIITQLENKGAIKKLSHISRSITIVKFRCPNCDYDLS